MAENSFYETFRCFLCCFLCCLLFTNGIRDCFFNTVPSGARRGGGSDFRESYSCIFFCCICRSFSHFPYFCGFVKTRFAWLSGPRLGLVWVLSGPCLLLVWVWALSAPCLGLALSGLLQEQQQLLLLLNCYCSLELILKTEH